MPAHGEPTFTVVICTFNRAHGLPRAVDSVLGQTCSDYELVVVDDGSTDDTWSLIGSFTDPRIRGVHQANAGLGAARNAGIAAARGRYVVFLDDDDLAFPTWLARFAAELDGDPGVVSCGNVEADDSGRIVRTPLPKQLGPAFAGCVGRFLAGTFVVRRDALEAVGGFRAGLPHLQQTELVLRLLPECRARGWDVRAIPEPLVQLHTGGPRRAGIDNTTKLLAAMEVVLAEQADVLARSPWVLAQYSAMAGVAAARTGEYRTARRHLRTAVRVRPRAWKHWARLGLASVPPIGRLVWQRQDRRAVVSLPA